MHAKVVVADGDVLTGSYNLSHGGEDNAENVLHIRSGALAQRFGTFVEGVAARYASARGVARVDPAAPSSRRGPRRTTSWA